MIQVDVPKVWLLVGAGVVLSLIGNAIRGRKVQEGGSSPFGRALAVIGLGALCLGLYAGFRGPLKIGSVTLEQFSFAHYFKRANAEATAYALRNLEVGSAPAAGWHGGSTSSLQYTVKNNGDRSVTCLMLRFRPETGTKMIELTVNGPFPARQTAIGCVNVPPAVSKSYFKGIARVEAGHIVGARF